MLRIVTLSGNSAAGKSHTLNMLEQALIAEGRPVVRIYGDSTLLGVSQAIGRVNRVIPRKGIQRFLPGFLFTPQFNDAPVTILIDDAPNALVNQLERTLKVDAFLVVVSA